MTFREKIIKYRADHNMTQAELGKMIDVSCRTIVSYERGEKKPYPKNFYRIAEKLGISAEYLMNDDCTDPYFGMEKPVSNDNYSLGIDSEAAYMAERFLNQGRDFFADDLFSRGQKEWVFNELMKAYVAYMNGEDSRSGARKYK